MHHDRLEAGVSEAVDNRPGYFEDRAPAIKGVEQTSRNDRVSLDFHDDWADVRMTIERGGRSLGIDLDSAQHSVTELLDSSDEPGRGPLLDYLFSRRYERRGWTLFRSKESGTAVAYVEVNWDDDDPGNYVAGGHWMHFAANEVGGCIGCVMERENPFYRILDFEGITLHPAGVKSELYALCHNSDTEMPADFDLASYADFNAFLSEVNVRESQFRIHLDTAPINSDGTIGDADIRLELDYFPEGTDTGGTWGGRFSGISDEHGHPNRAIGTLGGTWTHGQGGQGRFIGNFYVSSHPAKP